MLFACVSHPDVDVAFASLDAVGALLQTSKRQLQAEKRREGGSAGGETGRETGGRFRAMDHLPQLLATLYQRMK